MLARVRVPLHTSDNGTADQRHSSTLSAVEPEERARGSGNGTAEVIYSPSVGAAQPREHSRVSSKSAAEEALASRVVSAAPPAKRLRAFLGVMSNRRERRDIVRKTWLPRATGLQRCAPGSSHLGVTPPSWVPTGCQVRVAGKPRIKPRYRSLADSLETLVPLSGLGQRLSARVASALRLAVARGPSSGAVRASLHRQSDVAHPCFAQP